MKKLFLTFFITILITAATAFGETLTLTTYYPAPFGAYDQLRLVPRAALSGSCQIGTIYVKTPDQVQYCRDNGSGSGIWGTMPGVWTQNGNNIYPTDTASNPNLKVGIGTASPTAKLEIKSATFDDFLVLDRTEDAGVDQKVYLSPSFNPSGNTQLRVSIGSGNTVMTLTEDGKVGIGNTAPPYSLYVRTDQDSWQGRFANRAGAGADVYLANGQGYGMHIRGWTTDAKYTLQLFNADAQTNTFRNNGTVGLGLVGNVGIGTTNPTRKLEVSGDTQTDKLYLKADGTNVGELKAAYSGGNYYATYAP